MSFVAGGGIQSKSISEFDPGTSGGCVLWLDAADSSTLFTDTAGTTLAGNGDRIALWKDKSISANNATQTTAANRPTITRDANTNNSSMSFTTSQLFPLATTGLPTGTSPGTYFFVAKSSLTADKTFFIYGSGSGTAREWFIRVSGVQFRLGAIGGGYTDISNTLFNNANTMYTHIISNYISSLWGNGVVANNRNNVDLQSLSPAFNTNTTSGNIGSSTFDGTISEIIVFNRALQNDERQQVEGYLAWKWGLVQNLPTTHPYYYSKAPQTAFQPTSFPSCALWLDAADTNSITRSVSQWTDKSGLGNHVIQATAANQPTYSNNAIIFNGTSSTLPLTNPNVVVNTNFTLFFVERRKISKVSNFFMNGTDLGITNGNLHIGYGGANQADRPFLGFFSNDLLGASVGAYTTPVTRISKFSLTPTGRSIYMNGTLSNSDSISTKLVSNTGATIGGTISGGVFGYYQGDMFEIIFYANSSAAATIISQDQQVEGYLAWKWGVAASLPSDHPYKSGAPVNFTPTNITGCKLWLDAADSANIVAPNVTKVSDKSGNNTDLGTASGFTYSRTFNETYPSFFNSTAGNGFLGTNASFATANPMTLFSVIQSVGATTGRFPYLFNTGTSNRYYIYGNASSIARISAGGGSVDRPTDTDMSTIQVLSANFGTTSTTLFTNGTAGNVQTLTGGATTAITIGGNAGANVWLGHISEFILFNTTLSTAQRQQVEGYLGWKWGLQASLPSTHPFNPANYFFNNTRPFSRYFNPPDIEGCQLWMDAADTSTMSYQTINQWNDKSGNGRHFVGVGTSITPAFSPTSFFGSPGIVFIRPSNTSRSMLEWTNSVTPLTTSDLTLIMLVKRNAQNTSAEYLISASSTINLYPLDRNDSFGFVNSYAGYTTLWRNNDLTTTTPAIVGLGNVGDSEIITLTINKSALTSIIRKTTSSSTTSGTRTGEVNADLSLKHIRLGNLIGLSNNSSDGNQYTFEGVISEVLMYNSVLTTTQIEELEGYVAWKYNIASRMLPTGHLYKSSRPTNVIPTNISGCQLWLDASDPANMTFSTQTASVTNWNTWSDKSGNQNHARIFRGTPVYNSASKGFNTTTGNFIGPAAIPAAAVAPTITGFVVANGSGGRIWSLASNSTFGTYDYNTPTGIVLSTNISAYRSANTNNTGVFPVNTISMATTTLSSGGLLTYSINGNTSGTLYGTATNTSGQNLLNTYILGTNLVSDTQRWSGLIHECVLFDTLLTTSERQRVEGYLAWKWAFQASLPSSHPFSTTNASAGPVGFLPTSISGNRLWLDGADTATITLTPNTIADKSGLGNTLRAGNRLAYSTTLNNRRILSFSTSGDVNENTLYTPSLTRDGANFSAFYVCRYPSSGTYPVQPIAFDLSTVVSTALSAATNASITVLTVTSTSGFQVGYTVVITDAITATGSVVFNQTGIITAIASSTSMSVQLANGSPGTTTTTGTVTQLTASQLFGQDGVSPNFNIQNTNYEAGIVSRAINSFAYTPTLANNTFILGCVRQNGVFSLSTNGITHTVTNTGTTAIGNKTTGAYSIFGGVQGMDIGEVVVYNTALTPGERQVIEGYLSWKWGIQRATTVTNPSVSSALTYPKTHPFYSYPPVDTTPMLPAMRLYKKEFNPSDLAPVIWIDPQDSGAVTRDTASTNRVTTIRNKGSFVGDFIPPTGIAGPLVTRSSIGNGTNVEFLDFSNGGHYQVTSATMENSTTMALTVFPPHNGNIPVGAFINFTPTRGAYSDNLSATVSVGPFQILTATITSLRTLTITTMTAHGIGDTQPVELTINTGTFSDGDDASGISGSYTTAASGNSGSTIILTLASDRTNGLMAIADGHVRNNTGTVGPYITQTGTTGSTVKLTSYRSRTVGNLTDFMGRIEYGSIPITSGDIGSSTITLLSVTSSTFTVASTVPNTDGLTVGTILIPSATSGGLTSGTVYYITTIVSNTFKLASSLANAIAATTLTFTDNASLALATTCYGTRVTFRTPINHNISSNQVMNINTNGNFFVPFQAGAPTTDTTLGAAAIEFTSATISGTSPSQVLLISLATPVGRQNPFYAVISGVPTYTSRGPLTIRFQTGTTFSNSTTAANLEITGLLTSTNTSNNNVTSIELALGATGARPTGAMVFTGLPGILRSSSGANANALNIVATTTSVSGNTIILPTSSNYAAVGGRTVNNIGRLLTSSTPSDTANFTAYRSSCILYPVNGYAIENRALSSALNGSSSTIIWVSHLTNQITRNGKYGSANQSPVISAATTLDGVPGDDATSYRIYMGSFAGNAARYGIRHNGAQTTNFSTDVFWTDTTNPFRVNTAYLNLTSSATGDFPAYSRGHSLGAYRYDSVFYNNSGGTGPTSVVGGVSTGNLTPAHIRIGGRTDSTNSYTGENVLNGRWYEGGVGDVMIFNRILSVEERQLAEGFLAQKYRTTGSVGGNAITTNTAPGTAYAITGSQAITVSGSNYIITLNGTFSPAFSSPTITISGVTTATGLNNTWTLSTSTTSAVTFLSPTNNNMLWASGNGGTITGYTTAVGNSIHPYRLNPAGITGSNTLDLTSATSTYAQNLVAWFDAANVNSLTPTSASNTPGSIVTDNGVYSWANLGGSFGTSANLLQSTTASQPMFKTNILNGLPGIQFNGGAGVVSNIFATITLTQQQISTYSSNNEVTMFAVYQHSSVANDSFTLNISAQNNTRIALQKSAWNINQSGNAAGALSNYTPTFTPTVNKPYINVMRRSASTMTNRITGNGTQTTTSTSFANLALTGSFNQIMLGDYRSGDAGSSNRFNGYIYEVILFRSALTDQAIQQVEGYLAWKWGLQGSLPDTHAYKKVPA